MLDLRLSPEQVEATEAFRKVKLINLGTWATGKQSRLSQWSEFDDRYAVCHALTLTSLLQLYPRFMSLVTTQYWAG